MKRLISLFLSGLLATGLLSGAVALASPANPASPVSPTKAALAHPDSGPCCGPITPDGRHLIHAIDHSGVTHLWLAHEHVYWRSGRPDPHRPGRTRGTHCSAFAASFASRLNIYLLHPPKHGQDFLASAQADWLNSFAGLKAGWSPVNASTGQTLANQGELVVAVYKNPDPHKPGHIVILRPSEKTAAQLSLDGPQEAQAGEHNSTNTVVSRGFADHRGAWLPGDQGAILFFAHPVKWNKVS